MSQIEAGSDGALFHGWKIVGVSLLTQALQAGLLIYCFGTMAVAIEAEFGASRTQVMLGATLLSLVGSALSPWFGALVDRQSVRWLMVIATLALALGLLCLAQTRALWQVWVVFATLLPVANVLLGQLTSTALITRWFSRKRGRALGISAVGTSLGGFVFPVLLTTLMERFGWRLALMIIGVGALLVTIPLVLRFVVDRPEALGLYPDGAESPPSKLPTPVGKPGLGGIIRDPAFWLETVAVGVALFVYLGFLSNLYPHAIAVEVSPTAAATLMSIVAVCSIAGKLGFGAVADRLNLRYTLGSSLLLMIAGAAILSQSDGYGTVAVGAVAFGLAAGGLLPVWGALVARSFGPERFGRALGAMNLAMTPITLLSAPYAGFLFDRTGSYATAFGSYCVILLIALAALVPLKFPKLEE
jgi:MFS family permease